MNRTLILLLVLLWFSGNLIQEGDLTSYSCWLRSKLGVLLLTPLASGTGVKLLNSPYFLGSVMPLGMRLLPTTLPVPKTTKRELITIFKKNALLIKTLQFVITLFASGVGVKLLANPYFLGSVMPSAMRLLPTSLPVPKTTNPNPPAPALVHLTEPSKMGVNSHYKLQLNNQPSINSLYEIWEHMASLGTPVLNCVFFETNLK